jgi:hypothetical protein
MGSYWRNQDMPLLSNQPSPNRRKGRRLCGAKTRARGCCQVRAEPGKTRCRFHGGKSTGPKTQAGRARIAEAHDAGGSPIERGFGRSEVATKSDLKGDYLGPVSEVSPLECRLSKHEDGGMAAIANLRRLRETWRTQKRSPLLISVLRRLSLIAPALYFDSI